MKIKFSNWSAGGPFAFKMIMKHHFSPTSFHFIVLKFPICICTVHLCILYLLYVFSKCKECTVCEKKWITCKARLTKFTVTFEPWWFFRIVLSSLLMSKQISHITPLMSPCEFLHDYFINLALLYKRSEMEWLWMC